MSLRFGSCPDACDMGRPTTAGEVAGAITGRNSYPPYDRDMGWHEGTTPVDNRSDSSKPLTGRMYPTLDELMHNYRTFRYPAYNLTNPTTIAYTLVYEAKPGGSRKEYALPPMSTTEIKDLSPTARVWLLESTDPTRKPIIDSSYILNSPKMIMGGVAFDALPPMSGLHMSDMPNDATAGVWLVNHFTFPVQILMNERNTRQTPLVTATTYALGWPAGGGGPAPFLDRRVNYDQSVPKAGGGWLVKIPRDEDTTFRRRIAAVVQPGDKVFFTNENNGLMVGETLVLARAGVPFMATKISSKWQQNLVMGVCYPLPL